MFGDDEYFERFEQKIQAQMEELTLDQKGQASFPADFDKQSPTYQLAWLQRKIPPLKQEVSQLEKALADAQKEDAEYARRAKSGDSFFANIFGTAFSGATVMVAAAALKTKKDFLDEMEIREQVLTKQLSPQLAPVQTKPTRDEQIIESRIIQRQDRSLTVAARYAVARQIQSRDREGAVAETLENVTLLCEVQ